MDQVTAFVLAGGKSTRMGTEKALLELKGRTLLEWALENARAAATEVRIVGATARFAAYAETVEDIFPGRGPLGGIHAALTASPTDLNLVLAVDAPFVQPEFLRYLLAQARQSGALVTVPALAERAADAWRRLHERTSQARSATPINSPFQTLCGVYRRGFRERAEAALRAGRNKIDPLFTPAETRVIDAAEMQRLGFPPAMFDNLNSPEDLERAAKRR